MSGASAHLEGLWAATEALYVAWGDHAHPDGSDPHAPDLNTLHAVELAWQGLVTAMHAVYSPSPPGSGPSNTEVSP